MVDKRFIRRGTRAAEGGRSSVLYVDERSGDKN